MNPFSQTERNQPRGQRRRNSLKVASISVHYKNEALLRCMVDCVYDMHSPQMQFLKHASFWSVFASSFFGPDRELLASANYILHKKRVVSNFSLLEGGVQFEQIAAPHRHVP